MTEIISGDGWRFRLSWPQDLPDKEQLNQGHEAFPTSTVDSKMGFAEAGSKKKIVVRTDPVKV